MTRRPFISEKEIAALLRTPADKRRGHLLGQVADWGGVWCLADEGRWFFLERPGVVKTFPLWPHEPYANAYAVGIGRAGLQAVPIPLGRWFKEFGELLGGRPVELFPTASDPGEVMPARRFGDELERALAAYDLSPDDLDVDEGVE